MRSHRPGTRIREPALIDDHWLLTVGFRYDIAEDASVFHPLKIHGDDFGFVIMGQIIQKIRAVKRQGIAITDGLAEINFIMIRQII